MEARKIIITISITAILTLVGGLSVANQEEIVYEKEPTPPIKATITAYTSSVDETDDTPNITASGQRTRDGIIANNCLKFGEKVLINDELYEVQDRMNSRYGCEHFDIWMPNKPMAFEWGVRTSWVKILPD